LRCHIPGIVWVPFQFLQRKFLRFADKQFFSFIETEMAATKKKKMAAMDVSFLSHDHN
jgi:hypothetical protein